MDEEPILGPRRQSHRRVLARRQGGRRRVEDGLALLDNSARLVLAGRGVDEHLWLRRRTLAKPKPDASPEPVVATTYSV